jgi:hypothetical protein
MGMELLPRRGEGEMLLLIRVAYSKHGVHTFDAVAEPKIECIVSVDKIIDCDVAPLDKQRASDSRQLD